MQIIRFTDGGGAPQYGVLDGDSIHQLDGDLTNPSRGRRLTSLEQVTLLSHAHRRSLCARGGNYKSQLAEMNLPVPSQPYIFLKGLNTLIGPGDAIEHPKELDRLEYESDCNWQDRARDLRRQLCRLRARIHLRQ
jgi:2-keto-4-pentenoate hydratase/2-oxohepta-3-ene-1,7-dioic acid hydratase in catechol pathway